MSRNPKILDIPVAATNNLRSQLGSADRIRLDSYLASLSDLKKSLGAGLDVRNYSVTRTAARILEMVGSYDQARQLYTALDAAGAKSSETELAASAREVAKTGLTRLD